MAVSSSAVMTSTTGSDLGVTEKFRPRASTFVSSGDRGRLLKFLTVFSASNPPFVVKVERLLVSCSHLNFSCCIVLHGLFENLTTVPLSLRSLLRPPVPESPLSTSVNWWYRLQFAVAVASGNYSN